MYRGVMHPASSSTPHNVATALRLLTHASGNNPTTNTPAPGNPFTSAAAPATLVAIVTVTGVTPPSADVAGFTTHVAYAGTGAHVIATVPGTPAADVSSIGNTACPPAAIVAVVLPFALSAKSTPVPVSRKLCGDPAALSTTVKLPVSAPAVAGENVTAKVHAEPAASALPHVFVPETITKFPLTVKLAIDNATPPLLVSVTVCAAALSPTPVAANPTVPTGDSDTPAGATPTPFSATVCVRNSSVTASEPAPAPTLFGTNATSSAQLACPASVVPHPFTTVKSPLTILAATPVSAASPVFVSVTACVALAVPTVCAAKLKLNGASPSVAAACPTPLNATVCVPALSVTLKLPVRVPLAVGANATATVHPAPPPSVAPHVFAVIAKSPVTIGVPSVAGNPPVFDTVMFCAALSVPTVVAPYVTEIGINTIAAAAVPVPLNPAVACPPATFP